MVSLVGYTGFVGSNIYASAGGGIDRVYNSKNIEEAFGTSPDLLIYSGLRAEKYLANNFPEKDMEQVNEAWSNIERTAPRKTVLISTIDVFSDPSGADEDTVPVTEGLHAYGLNRYRLEQRVRERYPDALIIRLPGLFGRNIKKNFIYDFINVIPFMLKAEKFGELSLRDGSLEKYYTLQDNGFYRLAELGEAEKKELKEKFIKLGFTALDFTDSRSVFQFYPLARLWDDIQTALEKDIRLWHPAAEPVSAGEVYKALTGKEFVNEISPKPAFYDYRTLYAEDFGGKNGYIMDKAQVLEEICRFVSDVSGEGWK